MFKAETAEEAAERKRQVDAAYTASMVAGARRAFEATGYGFKVYRAYAELMSVRLQGDALTACLAQLWKAIEGTGEPEDWKTM